MKIIVDADACPRNVLQICMELGQSYNVPVWTVASFNHRIVSDHHVTVGNASQEADIKILNLAEAGDVIVTQDWGLAAMVLGKKAQCLSPLGKAFSDETISFLLEEREVKAKLRRSGARTGGPRKRTAGEDRAFFVSLDAILAAKTGLKGSPGVGS